MPRAKGGPKTRRRHKRQLKLASGFVGGRKLYRQARSTLEKGLTYAYRDRKQKKRDFRSLWIARINALAREYGLSYSRMIDGLKKAGVEIDRKQLAVLALERDRLFAELAETAKKALDAAAKPRPLRTPAGPFAGLTRTMCARVHMVFCLTLFVVFDAFCV